MYFNLRSGSVSTNRTIIHTTLKSVIRPIKCDVGTTFPLNIFDSIRIMIAFLQDLGDLLLLGNHIGKNSIQQL